MWSGRAWCIVSFTVAGGFLCSHSGYEGMYNRNCHLFFSTDLFIWYQICVNVTFYPLTFYDFYDAFHTISYVAVPYLFVMLLLLLYNWYTSQKDD